MPKVVAEYRVRARDRIVDAAQQMIRKKGFHAVTMADIAEEIGVSKGAIYLYFRTKTELLAEIQNRSRERVLASWEHLLERGDVVEGIVDSLDEVLSGEIDPAVWHELIMDAGKDPEVGEAMRTDQREDRKFMREFLERLEARGRIRPLEDPETVAEIILALLHATVFSLMVRVRPADARKSLVRGLRYLLDPKPTR